MDSVLMIYVAIFAIHRIITLEYTRSLKYQMILNSQTSLTRMDSVLSMHSAVVVEVVEGSKRPYKKTHLKQELLSLRLAPTKEGEGNPYIEGAQYVIDSGSPYGGGLVLLMHLNTDEVQDMISNLCNSPASYLYQYL
jgi:hypothetical protein